MRRIKAEGTETIETNQELPKKGGEIIYTKKV
jgi:hypothetical protein